MRCFYIGKGWEGFARTLRTHQTGMDNNKATDTLARSTDRRKASRSLKQKRAPARRQGSLSTAAAERATGPTPRSGDSCKVGKVPKDHIQKNLENANEGRPVPPMAAEGAPNANAAAGGGTEQTTKHARATRKGGPGGKPPTPDPLPLPPPHLWLSRRGANNQTGECDSQAAAVERRIALDAAQIMAKWQTDRLNR